MITLEDMELFLELIMRPVLRKIYPSGSEVKFKFAGRYDPSAGREGFLALLGGGNLSSAFFIGNYLLAVFRLAGPTEELKALLLDGYSDMDARELLQSLIQEEGNIISGLLSGTLSRILDEEVLPSSPLSVEEAFEATKWEGSLPVFWGVLGRFKRVSVGVYLIPLRPLIERLSADESVIDRALMKGHGDSRNAYRARRGLGR
ncbi:hypothetical protein [Thermococcus sp.]|uniref:hypothetical protein n=1 Tax=Thermococcus sp. TaxID=35749 RepID=UPI00262C9179|nr:hypothetical protein [Thermococcus sp.]